MQKFNKKFKLRKVKKFKARRGPRQTLNRRPFTITRLRVSIPRGFKRSLDPAVWKQMTPAQRNLHKARQKAFVFLKRNKRRNKKIKLILNKFPRHYTSAYRKAGVNNKSTARVLNSRLAHAIKKKLSISLQRRKKISVDSTVCAWKDILRSRGFEAANNELLPHIQTAAIELYTACVKYPSTLKKSYNRLIYWALDLPTYYVFNVSRCSRVVQNSRFVHVITEAESVQVDKEQYGSILVLNSRINFTIKDNPDSYKVIKSSKGESTYIRDGSLKENTIIRFYTALTKRPSLKHKLTAKIERNLGTSRTNNRLEKRGYIKHIVRMRYRWFFQPRLSQFKLFKKFFKRSLKRYRKISKNRLFITKFRSHFAKLTGFTEKGLMQLWLPFRRNYNQYWSANNAVSRFAQSLLLTPMSLLVFLRLSPSFAASKYITKSGAVSINGIAVTNFSKFKPGDIMQLNFIIWKSVYQFFDYQRWNSDVRLLQYVPFIQADWSSLMFIMIKWPKKYEVVAPSFLSERWARYYIRQFPCKIRNFKKADGNWKVYKRIIAKR